MDKLNNDVTGKISRLAREYNNPFSRAVGFPEKESP